MFSRVLIANRGEIACRVAKSVQAAGGQAVAVYSDADKGAPHVTLCDVAVSLGGSTAAESYLDADKVLAAAQAANADAIHPGYGFLSENADFARACEAAGLIFIGPSPEAIEVMGNKRAAKILVSQADVPCIPGYQGEDQSDATLIEEAARVGFPIMVKAAAGGGGRGMRIATSAAELPGALDSARTEAKNAFGSDELILERAISLGRHIEIQVAADSQGNVIHLGERDCSLQRRHQKVIEEAPSPFVSESLRDAMGQAAVNAARSCGYRGVGTVEFLVDEDESFCFLEMNTRLQVEHPVTELVTGTDLVDWQLKIAAGESLPLSQEEVSLTGHAIEARLYAENPAADFMPQTGRILSWQPPRGAGIRVDDGIAAPGEISPYYDSMVAKIIASGANREEARRRLLQALKSTSLLGVGTNRGFLAQLLEDQVFISGNATTSYIDDDVLDETRRRAELSAADLALAVVVLVRALDPQPNHLANWSNVAAIKRFKTLAVNDVAYATAYRARGSDYEVEIDGQTIDLVVETVSTDSGQPVGTLICRIDGVRIEVPTAFDGERSYLSLDQQELVVADLSYRPVLSESAAGSGQIMASTEGQVVKVAVAAGDRVEAGQLLVVVEAMKMEHRHLADGAGVVTAVQASEATQVKKNQLLVSLELDGAGDEEGA